MKLATAPVNWNNADVTDYRPWVPYPGLLDEMVAAGYNATEWGMNMERETAKLRSDLQQRSLQMLGGFVGLELRNSQNVRLRSRGRSRSAGFSSRLEVAT